MERKFRHLLISVVVGCSVIACNSKSGLRLGFFADKSDVQTASNPSSSPTAPTTMSPTPPWTPTPNPPSSATPTSTPTSTASAAPRRTSINDARQGHHEVGPVDRASFVNDVPTRLVRVITLTNDYRARSGLPPVVDNERLSAAAQAYAEKMAKERFFDHTDPNGGTPGDRITSQGYQWTTWGENLAAGLRSPEEVVQAWIDSSHHRANLLNSYFKEIGIGYAEDGYYWVQEFGVEKPADSSYK